MTIVRITRISTNRCLGGIIMALAGFCFASGQAGGSDTPGRAAGKYPYQNPALTVTERVEDLLARMSVEEKIGQMVVLKGWTTYRRSGHELGLDKAFEQLYAQNQVGGLGAFCRADWYTGKNWENGLTPALMGKAANMLQKYAMEHSRWGIPLYLEDPTVHGLMVLGGTVFPTGIGMGSTWNPGLVKEVAEVIAREATAIGSHRGSPSLDIARDPRWSRVEECFGEDPYLVARLGVATVKGLQGESFPAPGKILAVLRHFAAHGDPEGGHNAAACHVGPIELYNIQLKPFRDCVAAGARGIMSSYNTIDGIPCTGNPGLLTDLLRNQWGFKGYVGSDAGAISGLIGHRVAGDAAEACAVAVRAGVDKDLWNPDFFIRGMNQALERGLLTKEDLDRSVRRCLRIKFELGLFEHPFVDENKPRQILGCKAHREVALEAARQSLVLLSNPGRLLPLAGIKKLAVIGPNANTPMNQLGDYSAPQHREDIITVLDGVKRLATGRGIAVTYAKGCKVRSLNRDGFPEAVRAAEASDAVVLVLGGSSAPDGETGFMENGAARVQEIQTNNEIDKESGEGYDRASLRLAGRQLELLRAMKATGKPVMVVLIMGRPLIVDEVLDQAGAVLLAWYPGMMGGQAVAEALFGEYNPGGKLPISFPRDEGQLPVYYNSELRRHDYIDMKSSPRLPFGYGLNYTTFAYSGLRLSKNVVQAGEPARVTVQVRNTGKMAGDEVVQLYVTDQVASVARPYIELKGFQRIHLKAGESKTVSFALTAEELGFYNKNLEYVVEPGRFTLALGGGLEALHKIELEVKARAN